MLVNSFKFKLPKIVLKINVFIFLLMILFEIRYFQSTTENDNYYLLKNEIINRNLEW